METMVDAKQETCKERVASNLRGRIRDIRKLWALEQAGDEQSDPDLGTFNEYGLSFDYVAPGTFTGQRRGYFRYQLSWDGPSDEFLFYATEGFGLDRIEYRFLDWFDGACIRLKGRDLELMTEIWEMFKEVGSVETEYAKAPISRNGPDRPVAQLGKLGLRRQTATEIPVLSGHRELSE